MHLCSGPRFLKIFNKGGKNSKLNMLMKNSSVILPSIKFNQSQNLLLQHPQNHNSTLLAHSTRKSIQRGSSIAADGQLTWLVRMSGCLSPNWSWRGASIIMINKPSLGKKSMKWIVVAGKALARRRISDLRSSAILFLLSAPKFFYDLCPENAD